MVAMRIAIAAIVVGGVGGVAAADPSASVTETVGVRDRFHLAIEGEWIPYGVSGGHQFGEATSAYGVRGWVGYQLLRNLEAGVAASVLGPVITNGFDQARERDLIPSVVAHVEPLPGLDLALAGGVGISWFPLPSTFRDNTASGVVLDLTGHASYTIVRGLSAIVSVGYQRGAQTVQLLVTNQNDPGQGLNRLDLDVPTRFLHLGAGLACRF